MFRGSRMCTKPGQSLTINSLIAIMEKMLMVRLLVFLR